mgnify:CR=1 FL=1
MTGVSPEESASGEFGANEWLVDEMYERYLVDKESVDKSWWPILESYRPVDDPTPTSVIPVVSEVDAAPAPAPAPAESTPAESAPALAGSGRGLAGARQRARVFGGELEAGPRGRGWRVSAFVPIVPGTGGAAGVGQEGNP